MQSSAPDSGASLSDVTNKMRAEWDERARENARHYVATGKVEWNDEEYFESGRENVRREILTDMTNICQGKDPKQMKVLEIGCGSGRITRALSEIFGEVYAVDISGEMIRQATESLKDRPNAHVFQNSGSDLSVLGKIRVDFAFSFIVFQHIPSREVIQNYVREVNRVLRPGCLFKFQVQGYGTESDAPNTWEGVAFTDEEVLKMAEAENFEPRHRHGAGTQYFWLWYFKPHRSIWQRLTRALRRP
jgi:ubiquinone/menaquinone biosynthesis C-methylase UbiE